MPFLAHKDGTSSEFVVPEGISDGETIYCPACGGRMRPRGGSGSRAHHFMHIDNIGEGESDSCNGIDDHAGESAIHKKLKSVAVSGLRSRFSDQEITTHGIEIPVQVYRGKLDVRKRRADALVEFATENPFFGAGVVVEVQYKNKDKDIPEVTADYLEVGYSVFWADEHDFSDDVFDLDRFDQAFNDRAAVAFAPYYTTPKDARLVLEAAKYNLGNWSFIDPRPECNHGWHTGHLGNPFCLDCGTEVTTHEATGRKMYLPIGASKTANVERDSPFKIRNR